MVRYLSLIAAGALLAPVAGIAAPIGTATSARPVAQSEGSRGTLDLVKGSALEAYDTVRTGPGGSAKLRFFDASTLDVGPGALVTLDEFIYSGRSTASTASLTMARGAFRWVSGQSPKGAYDLKTPLANIGIRGTVLSITAASDVTTVRLQSGAATACSRVSGQCASVGRSGQGVRLWADGRVEMFGPGTGSAPVRRSALPPGGPDAPGGPGEPPIDPGLVVDGLAIGIGILGGIRGGRPPRVGRPPTTGGGTPGIRPNNPSYSPGISVPK